MTRTAPDRKKVIIALHHPAQHFSPAFRELERSSRFTCSVSFWDPHPTGYFDADFTQTVLWDNDLLSGYTWWAPSANAPHRRALELWRHIRVTSPDVVVCFGWTTPISRLTILSCLALRIPLLLYGDTNWRLRPPLYLRPLRTLLLRLLFRSAAGALSTGTFNRDVYIQSGMHPADIIESVYPIDVEHYASGTPKNGGDVSEPLITIGFAGKLIPRKGVDELLRALHLIDDVPWWRAWIIGDGPQSGELRRLTTRLGLADRVRFLGFRNTSELPSTFASLDILVLPSRWDNRGVVVAEAMVAGAAAVVSSNTGVWGESDLVESGLTGFVYPSGRPDALALILRRLLSDPALLSRTKSAGTQRARREGPESFARSLQEAVERFAE